MDSKSKRKEITALIDNIKKHSDRLDDEKSIPMLELSVILSKINRLHETTVVLKYLLAKEQHHEEEEFGSKEFITSTLIDSISEIASVEEEVQVSLTEESLAEDEVIVDDSAFQEDKIVEEKLEIVKEEEEDEIYVEMEVDEEDVKSIDLDVNEEIIVEMEVESESEEEDYIQGEIEVDESEISSLESLTDKINIEENKGVAEILKTLDQENISNLPDINEQYSEEEDKTLSDHLQKQPISDLVSAIGLNERYFYANELFNGDLEEFKNQLNRLNDSENFNVAQEKFQQLALKLHWESNNEMVKALLQLVERRFL